MMLLTILVLLVLGLFGYFAFAASITAPIGAHSKEGLINLANETEKTKKGLTEEQMKQFVKPFYPKKLATSDGSLASSKDSNSHAAKAKHPNSSRSINQLPRLPKLDLELPANKVGSKSSLAQQSEPAFDFAAPDETIITQDGEIKSGAQLSQPNYTEYKNHRNMDILETGYDKNSMEIDAISNLFIDTAKEKGAALSATNKSASEEKNKEVTWDDL